MSMIQIDLRVVAFSALSVATCALGGISCMTMHTTATSFISA